MTLPIPSPLSKVLVVLFGTIAVALPLMAENTAPDNNVMTSGPARRGNRGNPRGDSGRTIQRTGSEPTGASWKRPRRAAGM